MLTAFSTFIFLRYTAEHLLLDHNEFTGSLSLDWSGMKKLKSIVLHHNKLDGTIPSSIQGLVALHDLWLNDNVSVVIACTML